MVSKKNILANVRLISSAYAETYYIFQNFLDHIIDFGERNLLRQKYLPTRIKQYKGQKKLALLYHGYFQSTVGYEKLERLLESELFNIFAISGTYQPYSQDIRKSADYEMKILEWAIENTDVDEIYIIGHSQGGLVARYMLQFLGADKFVDKAIFLSTPHLGTYAAYTSSLNKALVETISRIFPNMRKIEGESALQMRPNSKFIKELNEKPLPQNVDFTSIYSYLDPVVIPSANAHLPYKEATNIMVRKIGHMFTMYDYEVVNLILKTLLLKRNNNLVHSTQIFDKRKFKGFDEIITF